MQHKLEIWFDVDDTHEDERGEPGVRTQFLVADIVEYASNEIGGYGEVQSIKHSFMPNVQFTVWADPPKNRGQIQRDRR